MKKQLILSLSLAVVVAACRKNSDSDTPAASQVTEQQVLDDFANVVANPNYADLQAKANTLNLAVQTLNSSVTEANLYAAQSAWRAVRVPWEQSEGFLFGPVEDFNYDPSTDTWPVNTVELNSLLASNNPLALADVEALQQDALKGYHPIEYLLFGTGGSRVISELGPRQLQYLVSLSQHLYDIVTNLRNDWITDPHQYAQQLTTAGNGSVRFATRKDAFLTIVEAMGAICDEVANGKMQEPFSVHDSEMVESKYAHNATLDFTNNIIGLQNSYMGRYGSGSGHSLHDLVSQKNTSLDNDIQAQINLSIEALQNIDQNFGIAIFNQQGQIISAQQTINELHDKLDLLKQFIETNITD